jgi:tripartite-type tricarboxylate transporter receptor subunit TctC
MKALDVRAHERKKMIRWLVLAGVLAVACTAQAQNNYPNRPIRLIIPWPPGQATDLVGRVIAQRLTELLGQPVVADNRPGAGGTIGTDQAAKAAADGYTVLAASSGPVTIAPLLQKVPYEAERDLAPVALSGRSPYMLVSAPSFPANNAREFVALLKANPGKYTFSSSGAGATAHLIAEWFNNSAGIQAVHVPFKGSAPAMTEVMNGQISYTLETAAATLPHIKAGRLKVYGVSLAKGSTLAPAIPPLATAADLSGFDAAAWIGIMVTAGTPKPVVGRLAAAMDKVMQSPEARERLGVVGIEVDYRPADEFGRYLAEQKARFADIIKRGNIKIQ